EAVKKQEYVANPETGVAPSSCVPLQISASRSGRYLRVVRPVGHTLSSYIRSKSRRRECRIDDVRRLPPVLVVPVLRDGADVDKSVGYFEAGNLDLLAGFHPTGL